MKRKLLLVIAMMAVLACFFALAVSAEVHSNVDKTTKVTLDSGTEVALFDSEGNALIWYFDNSGNLQSIRADDIEDGDNGVRVEYFIEADRGQTALAKVNIYSGSTIVGQNKNIVVFNIMDDDIAFDTDPNQEGIQKMTLIMETFNKINKAPNGAMLLEYAYLRLDTTKIGGRAFGDCTKLKYINIEELTELESLGATDGYNYGGAFRNCSSLFANQVVDLSKTKITTIKEGSPLYGNFAQTPISGIKLPSTVTFIGNHTFYGCKKLTTVWLSSNPEIEYNAFVEATSLKQIFYSGSSDSFNELLKNVSTSGNTSFLSAAGNPISYSNYKELADKNIVCAVYDYVTCLYGDPNAHNITTKLSVCAGYCSECKRDIVNHIETEKLVVKFDYSSYAAAGTKTTSCNNEGCTHQNVVTEAPAIFVALGYSVKEDGSALMGGYSINSKALIEYNNYADTPISYGIIMTNSQPNGNRVVIENGILKSDCGIQLSANDTSYARLNYTITGFETKEQSEINFIITLYVNDENGISFIQIDTKTSTANISVDSNDVILNTITHKTVAEATIANLTEEMNNETDAQEKQRLQAIIDKLSTYVIA